jgi:hypothetical protein
MIDLQNMDVNKNLKIFSFDAWSMYTNIPAHQVTTTTQKMSTNQSTPSELIKK